MNVYIGNERRNSKRVMFPLEVYYKEFNKTSNGFKHGRGKNISTTGMFFESYENFLPCTVLEVRIDVPLNDIDKKAITAVAEVIRNEEVKRQWLYNVGVSFCRISTEYKTTIEEYISKNSGSLLVISS